MRASREGGMEMITSATIAPNAATAASRASAGTGAAHDVLGKNDFLRLLVTQLQNQDPMEPVSDREFIAQMAQFSALEQMTNVSQGLTELAKRQDAASAYALLGKTVTVASPDSETVTGAVSAVQIDGGSARVVIGDGAYLATAIVQVRP
jgi:flagellar basal-body rod modification protein FlgD